MPFNIKDHKQKIADIQKLLKACQVKVKEVKEWGIKEFAYPINKMNKGYYVFMKLESEPKNIKTIEAKLKLESGIIRHLLTKVDPNKDQ